MSFNHQSGSTLSIQGAEIYFEIVGNQDAPPLLLLHGGVGSIEDFTPLLPGLADSFRVIAIDSRGHGRSTLGDGPLTYQRLAEDAIQVLRHLQLSRTAVLGFSDGGIVGYRLMASGEITVSKLATIGAAYELRADDPVREIYARVTGESWRKKFPDTYDLYQQLNPEPDFARLITASVKMWLDDTATGYPGDTVDRLSGDVLIMRGDEDQFFPRQAAVDLANRVRGSVLANIAFASHVAYEDQKEIVLLTLREFLKARDANQ